MYNTINWRYVQRKNAVNDLDMSRLREHLINSLVQRTLPTVFVISEQPDVISFNKYII